jgi:phage gpG-like protein
MIQIKVNTNKFEKDIAKYLKELEKLPIQLAKDMYDESIDTFTNNNWELKVDGSPATLIDTGRMKRSIKSSYDTDSSTVYSNALYSGYHQYGTAVLPVRKFIIEDEEIIKVLVENLINKIFI